MRLYACTSLGDSVLRCLKREFNRDGSGWHHLVADPVLANQAALRYSLREGRAIELNTEYEYTSSRLLLRWFYRITTIHWYIERVRVQHYCTVCEVD